MILLDIINDDISFTEGTYVKLSLCNNYNDYEYKSSANSNAIINDNLKKNDIIKINIKICRFVGEGSYGKAYKIKYNDKYYVMKINNNEVPEKLIDRYNSLINYEELHKYIIPMNICGKIKLRSYSYFCIMEYGGKNLKSYTSNIDCIPTLIYILRQLCNVVYLCQKYRILIPDFKLSNITINSQHKIQLIDLYMDCGGYSPCVACRIVKTYSTIEIDKEKRIYENPEYNYTCIYIPFAISLIDILCVASASNYFDKLARKFHIDLNIKGMIPLIQIACYNYSNDTHSSIKSYQNIYQYKKKLERKYSIITSPEFYEYFMELIEIKSEFKDFISKKKISLILNDLFSVDPEQRSLHYLKDKLK